MITVLTQWCKVRFASTYIVITTYSSVGSYLSQDIYFLTYRAVIKQFLPHSLIALAQNVRVTFNLRETLKHFVILTIFCR